MIFTYCVCSMKLVKEDNFFKPFILLPCMKNKGNGSRKKPLIWVKLYKPKNHSSCTVLMVKSIIVTTVGLMILKVWQYIYHSGAAFRGTTQKLIDFFITNKVGYYTTHF